MIDDKVRVLVTGGAGYIGSHAVKQLIGAGFEVTVYDNLSSGSAWAVGDADLVVADLAERSRLDELVRSRRFAAVMHFAASVRVEESVRDPALYYRNNVVNALNLFETAARHGIGATVFSSTAAVYGEPAGGLVDEETPLAPINPYGASKMMAERALQDIARAAGMPVAILRYFNVAGAALDGSIGQATPDATHLIKVACQAALGLRDGMQIYGTDYPTPDGTCVRDYIHVQDLADAHVAILKHLLAGGETMVLNCGYGRGLSVREVIDAVRRVTGVDLAVREGPRRPGDPAQLVAANRRILQALDWRPRHADLDLIIASAWRFEQKLHAGAFGGRADPAAAPSA